MTNNIIEKAMIENQRIVQRLINSEVDAVRYNDRRMEKIKLNTIYGRFGFVKDINSETTEEIHNGLGRDAWCTYHTESGIEKQLTSDSVVGLIEQFTEQE